MSVPSEGRILVVEDDDDHARLIERSLRKVASEIEIMRLSDGDQALRYLQQTDEFEERTRPTLILLDLKLPKVDGLEVLGAVKSDPSLRSIPVIMLTTSDSDSDKKKAYLAFANGYLVKPVTSESFKEMMSALDSYWRIWNRSLLVAPEKER